MTTAELNRIDLLTISSAQRVIVAAIEDRICKWEQNSHDYAIQGELGSALMASHWVFAAQLLRTITINELSDLTGRAAAVQWSSMPQQEPTRELEQVA